MAGDSGSSKRPLQAKDGEGSSKKGSGSKTKDIASQDTVSAHTSNGSDHSQGGHYPKKLGTAKDYLRVIFGCDNKDSQGNKEDSSGSSYGQWESHEGPHSSWRPGGGRPKLTETLGTLNDDEDAILLANNPQAQYAEAVLFSQQPSQSQRVLA